MKALKEEEERRAELEEDEMLYIYSKDESQVKKGRKPLKIKPKPKTSSKASLSGSDLEDSFSGKVTGGRKASGSPQKSPSHTLNPDTKSVIGKTNLGKKSEKLSNDLPKGQNVPKKRGRKKGVNNSNVNQKPVRLNSLGQPIRRGRPRKIIPVENVDTNQEKKETVVLNTPKLLQNGHSPTLSNINSKMTTQARNALLKLQAQQAAHINVSPNNTALITPPTPPNTAPVTNALSSPPARLPTKPATPKSPSDPNIPPPWSNPNLVIRTRKAAVHSPVIVAHTKPPVQKPLQSALQQPVTLNTTTITAVSNPITLYTTNTTSTYNTIPATTIFATNPTSVNSGKIQLTPDRNIFQLFTANTSRGNVTFTPTIRHVSPVVSATPGMNQLRGATVINSVSLVNAGARFITTGVAGQPSVVVSAAPKACAGNVGGAVSNITLVPTVINASGGQTLIPAGGATLLTNTAGGGRTVLNTTRLTSPITLQSLSSLPYAVNIIKTNTGLTLPVRSPQILHTSLAQVAGQPGYVLITPRARNPAPGNLPVTSQTVPISLVQTIPGQSLQTARVHLLAQVPTGATVMQQPQLPKPAHPTQPHQPNPNVNGVAKKDGT